MAEEVYIVSGKRTPFIRALGKPNSLSAADLGTYAAKELLLSHNFSPEDIGEVVVGCVAPAANEANIARIISLRLGCGKKVPAYTVARNCASGLQAIDSAVKDIINGRHDLVIAGGTEAMSRIPLFYSEKMTEWLAALTYAKTFGKKLSTILKFRPKLLAPVIGIIQGLTDHVVNMNMGETAEELRFKFNLSREELDTFALQSHLRATKATKDGYFNKEIAPLFDWKHHYFDYDNGVRPDSSLEKLSKLKPVFDKKYGSVTAGNSSQITDGSAMLLLASKTAVNKYNLNPIARVVDFEWSGVDPTIMGLGPVHAISGLLTRNKLSLNDIDYWEINEAFASQVLACTRAMESDSYCKNELGLSKALGKIDQSKLNVDGGAIAIGHPVGSSGARLPLHLMHTLARNNAKYGIASLCIGGGQGGAVLIENVAGE